jgi:hypothetical protein
MGALFVIMLLSAAAIGAASGDIHLSRYDQDDKQAYAAAEAGINDYLFHLNQDSNYWTLCTGVPTPNAVNQAFTGSPPAGRKWRDVPGGESEYSIELIPAPGKTACDPSDPIGSMIDADGNIKVRSTGHVKGTSNVRAIVTTLRRKGFLDFLYFTDLENQDLSYSKFELSSIPTRATTTAGTPVSGLDLLNWAADKCERHWWGTQAVPGEGRGQLPIWTGQLWDSTDSRYEGPDGRTTTAYQLRTTDVISGFTDPFAICGEIQFADADFVRGPFHSNDDILVCGTPEFGRVGYNDSVEVSGNGWRACSGGANPIFRPSLRTKAQQLDLPPSNAALERTASASYIYEGETTIQLTGTTMTVTNPNRNGGAPQAGVALPSNGVILVKNTTCSSAYDPLNSETREAGCGDVRLSGSYSKDLTIAAQKDIIITGNVKRPTNTKYLLGLIADGFVRVWHPVNKDSEGNCTGNRSDTPTNIDVDAALLSLQHSFTVDNYWCGSPLGNLTIKGVIAQKHRGVVGRGGSSISNGYVKNYNYDEQLRYRSPPYFLDPVQASWRVIRHSEQTPAR